MSNRDVTTDEYLEVQVDFSDIVPESDKRPPYNPAAAAFGEVDGG